MNMHAGFVRREEMVELQRMLSEHVNLNDALKKKNVELEDEVKELLDWQEELTQNAKEAEKDFNVKHRLWTEENSILQNRNRALADERDKKDKEVSDVKDQLHIAQQAAQRAEEQLNQMTIAYREIRATHEGLPDRYEAAKLAAQEASDSLASKDATIQSLQGQLTAKQAELDALSGSTESRAGKLQKALDAEQQRHEQEISEAHRRWEESLARIQGDKVMAEACAEQIKAELQDLQRRFDLMQADVRTRDERAGAQIKQLEADVAKQVEEVQQAQNALKSAEEELVKQRAVAVDAEAAMKAAQAEAVAAAEKVKIEKETGAECTEEAIRAVTAADVQLQQAKERDEELARREKQIEAREVLVQQELQQREQALEGQLKAMEDAAAAQVRAAEEQVGAVIEKEREAIRKASSEDQRQLKAELDASQQRCSELEEQIASLKQELSEAAVAVATTVGKENAMDVDGGAENGGVKERIAGMKEKEAELKQSVGELERRSEKLQNEVKNAASAREELARLRKDVRDMSSQKGELENLVRELQKEEFTLRTRITGAKAAHTAAPIGNSGSKHDSVPAPAGSGPVASLPFGSPALPAAVALAGVGHAKKNGAATSEQEELVLSPGDGVAKSNNTPLPNAEPSQNQTGTPVSKGSGLLGGLWSKAAGIFGGTTPNSGGNTPGLLADSVDRIAVEAGAAQAGTAAVEFSPPGGPEIAYTPRIGDGAARTSTNAVAKQRNQREQQAAAAGNTARPADVSPEGIARLAARAKSAADAAARKGTASGAPNTRKAAQGASAVGSIPKRPLSGSKRRRGVEDIPAAGQVEADAQDTEAADAEASAAPEPSESAPRTSKLNALAANTSVAGKATRGAKSGIGKGISAAGGADAEKADAATDRTRKRVTHKATKDTASAGQPAATAARASQRKAAATPRGADSAAAQQNVTPPKIGGGAAAARGAAAATDRRRKRAAGDDAKSGTTSISKSGVSAGLRRTASKEPVSKKRAVARDGNGLGTSAAAVAGTSRADEHASGWAGKPLQIPSSADAEEAAQDGEANEGDDGDEHPSTPHGMSARVQHLVEEAAAYTGYSPAELVNEDGQPISARALRAASRAQSRSTMTPGKGVEEGEEAEGGAGHYATPRTRRTGLRTRHRSLHDIEENEEELIAGDEDAE